ncbi:MAG: hypothetical protein ACPGSB_04430 [Opitutales bacterium]
MNHHLPAAWLVALVFASGFAGLVYQLLWMRQLGLLFGNTAEASSVTLAVFFAGLGVGNWWWGRRMHRAQNPFRLYALLEFGIATNALIYFVLLAVFSAIYPWVYQSLPGTGSLLLLKIGLSAFLIFPAAFFMGGTVPVIGQVAIRNASSFGWIGSVLYGVNTLGAAIGVTCAAFLMIPSFGYHLTYGTAVLISVGVGLVSWFYSGKSQPHLRSVLADNIEPDGDNSELSQTSRLAIAALCFFSGFVVLALEVAWMRVFSQVHENSVYSYAIILIVVLVCLAVGAGISSVLSRLYQQSMRVLGILVVLGGSLLVVGPTMLMRVTNEMEPVHTFEAWDTYVIGLFKMGFGGLGPVVIALGTVFPYLMKMAEHEVRLPGKTLGWMLGINTAGAILGSLFCAFVFLPQFGMWQTFQILTAFYLYIAIMLPMGWKRAAVLCRATGGVALVLLFTLFSPVDLPVVGFVPGKEKPRVLEAFEEIDCTLTVVERANGHRALIVNGAYSLGSTAAYTEQANQSRIPLYLFPETESICFIGLGTGISAGASLKDEFPNVKRVVSCELSAAVVEAARKWIPESMTGGVFTDPRSEILVEDGRNYLMATGESFDMINADLFLPYRRGTGSLYSLKHFQTAATRLNPGGVYVQWLPLYQLTGDEFAVIARTMLEVFDQVTMWRNNFVPGEEKVALIGRMEPAAIGIPPGGDREMMLRAVDGLTRVYLSPDMVQVEEESIAFFYAGNLSQAEDLFLNYPVNTDNRPVIEYQTPKGFREAVVYDEVIWCVGPNFVQWVERIFKASPLEKDPIFKGHPVEIIHQVKSGEAFHRSMVHTAMGEFEAADEFWETFKTHWRKGAR